MSGRGLVHDIEALQNASAAPILPPEDADLNAKEKGLWARFILQRSRGEWQESDLHHLVTLVRLMVDIDRITKELRDEPDTTRNAAGTTIANPKYGIVDRLQARAVVLTRLLQLAAGSKVNNDINQLKAQRAAERNARDGIATRRAMLDDEDDEELLAKPPSGTVQ
jgi:hypothetical protein